MSEERTLEDLGLSTFDFRKAQYLLGKPAWRDLGVIQELHIKEGDVFTVEHISALLKNGLLNTIFLEQTQAKK
jgi:hypothetical protein